LANFFSADYWKAFYFKAMGGQETAVDPNAMSGSFAGSSSWTGTLDQPTGSISGAFAGLSEFTGTLTSVSTPVRRFGGGMWPNRSQEVRRKRRIEELEELEEMIAAALVGMTGDKPSPPTKTVIKKIERQAERLDLAQEIDRRASAKAIEVALVGLRAEINQLFATARQTAETAEAARIAQELHDDEEEIIILLMAA
jgi:signal transduction histidine kinase